MKYRLRQFYSWILWAEDEMGEERKEGEEDFLPLFKNAKWQISPYSKLNIPHRELKFKAIFYHFKNT